MSRFVILVDLFGLLLAATGFCMAFRQNFVKRLIGRPPHPRVTLNGHGDDQDPLTYVLRISGVMVMVFGIVIGGMVTMFNLA
ncbi:MAG: hypothetical protein CMH85_18365 [Novosphingobium sp.]|jgi:hypothetical protein|nr:hypothetical protein [Novosphingobium sp.]